MYLYSSFMKKTPFFFQKNSSLLSAQYPINPSKLLFFLKKAIETNDAAGALDHQKIVS